MKPRSTIYGLVGTVAKLAGLAGATLVLLIGSFQGVSGQALFVRVGLAFLIVTIVFNLIGFVTVRSLLTAIVSENEERKETTDAKHKASETS
ncbi:MAG: hypothetical protein ACKVU1_09195 [bacterium]